MGERAEVAVELRTTPLRDPETGRRGVAVLIRIGERRPWREFLSRWEEANDGCR